MRAALTLIVLALAAPAAATPAADVAKLAWIAGTWSETKGQVTTKETWQAPAHGVMSGVTETSRAGKAPSTEPMQISAEPAGVTFTAMPAGQPPTPFVLLSGKAGEAVFENKAHDFPQRVIYRRCGADLCARIEGMLNGKLEGQDWRYTRIK